MELELIKSRIYEIRGQKVMLDFDLAELYGTETKRLKEGVRRNIKRFPGDFVFELTREEYLSLRTQIASLNKGRGKHAKYSPFAFTEFGVAMLSSILNSDVAIEINISIMRAFVAVRHIVLYPPSDRTSLLENRMGELKEYIEEMFTDQNDINEDTRVQLELIGQTLAELQTNRCELPVSRNKIGFRLPEEQK